MHVQYTLCVHVSGNFSIESYKVYMSSPGKRSPHPASGFHARARPIFYLASDTGYLDIYGNHSGIRHRNVFCMQIFTKRVPYAEEPAGCN